MCYNHGEFVANYVKKEKKMVSYEKIELDENLPIKLLYYEYHEKVDSKFKHWHRSPEIIFPIKGHTVLEEYDNDTAQIIKIQENDFYIINSRHIHEFDSKNRSMIYQGYALQISYEYCNSLCSIDDYQFLQPSGKLKETMYQEIQAIIDTYHSTDSFKSIKIRSHLDMLIYLMLSHSTKNKHLRLKVKSDKNKEKITKVITYINNHYTEDISVNELAQYFKMSRSHLTKLFKENTGSNMKEYIIDIKLIHSIDDLLMTDYPIVDIAFKNGFSNIQSFNSYFKKKYQMTPKEYRQKHRMK